MTKTTALILALAILLASGTALAAGAYPENITELKVTDYLADQAAVDELLIAESKAGHLFADPLVVIDPYSRAALSAGAIFSTETETGGSILVKGKAPEDDIMGTFVPAKNHIVPIYGLYAGEMTEVLLTLDNGEETTLQITTDQVFSALSNVKAEMYDASQYDYSTLTICGIMNGYYLVGYDSKGDVRWHYSGNGMMGITLLDNGHILIPNGDSVGREFPNGRTGVREIDFMGKTYAETVWDGGQHHDMIQLSNGNIMAVSSTPSLSGNRDYVTEVDSKTGAVVWELAMSSIIDPSDGGSLIRKDEDWCHNNALYFDEENDLLLVSCRHLDAVAGIRKSTKELLWLLGDPSGWEKADKSLFFTPVGENFEWQYGQHQVTILSNGDILLFDNGSGGRVKAPEADKALTPQQQYSRAVIYRINPMVMTIEQIWQYGKERGPQLYCDSMCGVDCLDEETMTFLVDFGVCSFDISLNAPSPDRTIYSYINYLVGGKPVWELTYQGSNTYRTKRLDLYAMGEGYTPERHGENLGNLSITGTVDLSFDLTSAAALPEGPVITLYPALLAVTGKYVLPTSDLLVDDYLILRHADGTQSAYKLGQTTSKLKDDTLQVTLYKPISVFGIPAGEHDVFLSVGGTVYNTGYRLIK